MKGYTNIQKIISYVLKAIVFFSACIGVFASAYAGRNSFMGGSTVFMYFTIQSNIAIAIIMAIGAGYLWKNKYSETWHVIKFIGTVAITLTGMVFCFVLAPTMGGAAWNLQNDLTHVVVPIISVIDFFVTGVSADIKKKNTFLVIIPPILYAIYAGIGYVMKWEFAPGIHYPYFFLNWGSPLGAFGFGKELPFMGCAWWILALFVFLIVVGFAYLGLVDLLKKIRK